MLLGNNIKFIEDLINVKLQGYFSTYLMELFHWSSWIIFLDSTFIFQTNFRFLLHFLPLPASRKCTDCVVTTATTSIYMKHSWNSYKNQFILSYPFHQIQNIWIRCLTPTRSRHSIISLERCTGLYKVGRQICQFLQLLFISVSHFMKSTHNMKSTHKPICHKRSGTLLWRD